MAKIQAKTRGDSSVQGKPRVWFCAHADDYRAFLTPTADEILKKQNCAVYYDKEPTADYNEEEFFLDLKRMNLFVMPVTSRLLHTKNRALDVEFRFALEHRIPVLPIMQESGLEQAFNKICGDLQFLDPRAKDATAIPYDEKLTKYLNSVLIGDELAKKIRKAFDAYIFLSYRKKDRKYAQELMRLIHKNDFCRDIAIWYDEFLIPGENFNDAIAEAMKKSKLFALAVTPNLVNEKNYVMTVEYPEAKKANKPILPAELVPTDGALLKQYYENIPDTTDAADEAALTDALKEHLHGIAIRENDTDPEHNFFIGLAYLGGVDVETDRARALELIEGAANANLPEAMEKLVSMYRAGEGVARDYRKAVEWQRKLAAYRKAEYEKAHGEYDAYQYISDIWILGDYIYELQQITDAEAVYVEMYSACEEMNERFATNRTKRNLSVSYNNLGDIAKAQGKLDAAKVFYEKGLAIREAIARESGTVEARRDLSVSYCSLGNIAKAQGKLDAAKAFYEKGLAIDKALARESGTVEARRDLSISYNKLGNIAEAQRKLDAAKAFYEKGLATRKAIARESGTVEAYDDLAVSYYNMAFTAQDGKKRQYLQQALSIWTRLAEQSPSYPSFAERRDIAKRALTALPDTQAAEETKKKDTLAGKICRGIRALFKKS